MKVSVGAGLEQMADVDGHGDALSSAAAQEANGIAFLLSSAAYLILADAYLRCEGLRGLTLMDEIEGRIAEATQSFLDEYPEDVARPDIVAHATQKVRELLEAGRNLFPKASFPQQ